MFDFHMHSGVSFDTDSKPIDMARAAAEKGLKEICFTDHYDPHFYPTGKHELFTLEEYADAYDSLSYPGLTIRRGVELGLTDWDVELTADLLNKRAFDFVIGSVHMADGTDPYFPEYWVGKTLADAFTVYLEQTLKCVRLHSNFDVLGHLTYVCKSPHNTYHLPVCHEDYREICDEIMRELVRRGKGMEINTSGINSPGVYLPEKSFLQRFRELGGEIVTLGSDAHTPDRVGQHFDGAIDILRDVFGYVCTFEDRKPIFHKL